MNHWDQILVKALDYETYKHQCHRSLSMTRAFEWKNLNKPIRWIRTEHALLHTYLPRWNNKSCDWIEEQLRNVCIERWIRVRVVTRLYKHSKLISKDMATHLAKHLHTFRFLSILGRELNTHPTDRLHNILFER